MRKHLIIAGVIVAFEASVGVGVLGMGSGMGFIAAFVIMAIAQRERWSEWLRIAGIYALMFVATMAVILWNVSVAQSRAAPVISAVNRYHSEHGEYPKTLGVLVPSYLPSTPHAGFTLLSRDFRYFNDEKPQLYLPAMFHGVFAYDFSTNSWRTNE